MGTRVQSHQLSNGLYVSGRPKERQPTIVSRAIPYTGGDVNKSGELGKMFDIPVSDHRASSSSSGSVRSGSGPISKRTSGSGGLHPTGMLTSGPLGSSRSSGQVEASGKGKSVYGPAVTTLGYEEVRLGFKVSKRLMWMLLVMAVIGVMVGTFLTVAVKKPLILVAVIAVLLVVVVLVIVTCGSVPLESSFQKVGRCVYVSTELYEYKGMHRWGCRNTETYVADFYISDFQSGLRAVVKAGYGAKVAPFVKQTTVININNKEDSSPGFVSWLEERSLNPSLMRLKEGYIKEGSTVSVMGVVRRHDNVVMIVPPADPITTGCHWSCGLFPVYVQGLVLTCDENQDAHVIPV
ncbi:hypothetical protein E3N88_05247 [Mikania micrantha]|uniref:Ubiquitin-specific protease family C19-related protein n=1 Tax=Mikania micrantha TaxID=192012 RepID=A0A5N6PWT5_9ASTR|nr:hypothetical protein E3N88_05247 [Mikania micrantha]